MTAPRASSAAASLLWIQLIANCPNTFLTGVPGEPAPVTLRHTVLDAPAN